jgi:phospholipid/cholesterol/gamma-HCH transport system substrate-binding protein
MKRTGKIKWGNVKVGLLVTFALAAVLYSSFFGGGASFFAPKDALVAYFQNVSGLMKGASVRMSGVEVGSVKSIHFVNLDIRRRLKVEITVKEATWSLITADSKVQLGTLGLLGDKYLEVLPGTPGLPVVKPGDELSVVDEVSLDALVQKSPEVTQSVDSILAHIEDVSRRLADGQGTAGKILSDTVLYERLINALDQVSEVMSEIRKNQRQILDKLASTLDNTSDLTGKMRAGQGSLGKLANDVNLYDNMSRSAARLDSILAKINRGEGSAGALVNDAQLYEEIRNLVTRINSLVTDIEKNPRKYFKFSVF